MTVLSPRANYESLSSQLKASKWKHFSLLLFHMELEHCVSWGPFPRPFVSSLSENKRQKLSIPLDVKHVSYIKCRLEELGTLPLCNHSYKPSIFIWIISVNTALWVQELHFREEMIGSEESSDLCRVDCPLPFHSSPLQLDLREVNSHGRKLSATWPFVTKQKEQVWGVWVLAPVVFSSGLSDIRWFPPKILEERASSDLLSEDQDCYYYSTKVYWHMWTLYCLWHWEGFKRHSLVV